MKHVFVYINSERILRFSKISFIWIINFLIFISSCNAQKTFYRYTPPLDLNDGLKDFFMVPDGMTGTPYTPSLKLSPRR
jgi:hypothetical protein